MTNRGAGGHDLTVFSIAPQRLGGMDLVIPLFHALKSEAPNCRIHLVFFENRPYRQVIENEFYRTEIEGLVASVVLLPPLQPRDGVLRQATAWLARLRGALRLIAAIATTRRPLLLHSRQLTTRLLRLVNRVVKARGGRVLGHAALQTISFDRKPKKRIVATLVGDGYLGFGDGDTPYLKASGHDPVFRIGYPKLYSHWTTRIKKEAPAWVRAELVHRGIAADKPIVLVLLGSVVPGIYDREEFDAWLGQVIAVIGHKLPDYATILKPHPMEDMDRIRQVISSVRAPDTIISLLPPSFLATSSRLAISFHSSAIIDALGVGTPTILFQDFTAHWLDAHPEKSSFLHLGIPHARDVAELESAIETVLAPTYTVPDVRKILGHREDLSPLFAHITPQGQAG